MNRTKIKLAAVSLATLAATFAAARPGATVARKNRDAGQPRAESRKIDAAQLFAKNCATCHGKDGRAKTFKSKLHVHARDLADAAWQSQATDERLADSIAQGRGHMPAFGRKLTREEITSLVAYVRGFKK
jgi:mono/diheme cytochrome c family protein